MDQYYKYFRWLSLDIVLGAIFFLCYLEDYYRLSLSYHVYFALASAIWLIYTVDHLIDAHSSSVQVCDRHGFHKKHFSRLILVGGLVLSLALVNLYFLEIELLKVGALLAAFCVLYLLLVYFHKRFWVKELLVAVVYSLGIFLAPFVQATVGNYDFILAIQLAFIAFANLLIFSKFDLKKDHESGFNSLAIRLGKYRTDWLIQVVIIGDIVGSGISFISGWGEIQLLYCLMSIILGGVYWLPSYFQKSERFRIAGDGVFYLPFLFLM
jgi:4-hydroxybenzoate polyprenyltransferase